MDAGQRRGVRADRFIPTKAGMDWNWDYLSYQGDREGEPTSYKEVMADIFNQRRPWFIFNNRPPIPVNPIPTKPAAKQPRRHIPNCPDFQLDLPNLLTDDSLNLLDWGSCGVLSVALASTVYLRHQNGSVAELATLDINGVSAIVPSLKWAPDGWRIALVAVTSDESQIQIWDSTSSSLLSSFKSWDSASAPCSMDWLDNSVLATGGMTGQVASHDVRMRDQFVQSYRRSRHRGGGKLEACALKWSASGHQLASGATDGTLHIWDRRKATKWLHCLRDHRDTVKALAWCPFQGNLLASGGAAQDGCIKFWNTQIGACLNSVDTASQVTALLWNSKERELLSSHGLPNNQLRLWNYPSMAKISDLTGHQSTVLHMALSPNDCTVASASADEALYLWNVFGTGCAPREQARREPFADFSRSSIR